MKYRTRELKLAVLLIALTFIAATFHGCSDIDGKKSGETENPDWIEVKFNLQRQ